jgi:hypothetical protein
MDSVVPLRTDLCRNSVLFVVLNKASRGCQHRSSKGSRYTLSGLRKKSKRVLLNLVASTRLLRCVVRIHDPLLFGLSSFVCWVTRRLRSSFALALPPLIQVLLPPTQILPLPLPPPPLPPPPSPLKDPYATGKPDSIYTSQQVDGGVDLYSWALACVPLC